MLHSNDFTTCTNLEKKLYNYAKLNLLSFEAETPNGKNKKIIITSLKQVLTTCIKEIIPSLENKISSLVFQ